MSDTTKKLKDVSPEAIQFLVETNKFTRKWNTPRIAKAFGMSRQALEYHIDKTEEHETL